MARSFFEKIQGSEKARPGIAWIASSGEAI
jgi:hypothetical protein